MLFQHDNQENVKQLWFTSSVYCGIRRLLFHAGVVSKCLKEEAGPDVGLEGCLRVIQPKRCYKGNRMDEELKKQSLTPYKFLIPALARETSDLSAMLVGLSVKYLKKT